jgi:hypothetical protein
MSEEDALSNICARHAVSSASRVRFPLRQPALFSNSRQLFVRAHIEKRERRSRKALLLNANMHTHTRSITSRVHAKAGVALVLIALGNKEKRFCTSDLRAREKESAKATLSALSAVSILLSNTHTQQKAAHGSSREISSLQLYIPSTTAGLCTSAFCFYFHKLRCVLAGDESAFIPWCAPALSCSSIAALCVEYKHTQGRRSRRHESR